MWEEQLKIYDALVAKCDRFERKGKSVPHTSANGYMFSLLNKEAEIGIRFAKDVQEKYIQELNTTIFQSHRATMKGYIKIPKAIFGQPIYQEQVQQAFNGSMEHPCMRHRLKPSKSLKRPSFFSELVKIERGISGWVEPMGLGDLMVNK